MNITWYGKNNDTIDSELTANCQLLEKITSYDNNHKGELITLIFGKPDYMTSFLKNLKGMSNIFDGLNFKIGVMQQEPQIQKIDNYLVDSTVIFIGDDSDEEKYLSVFNAAACIISSKTDGSDINIGYQRHFSNNSNPLAVSLSEMRSNFSLAESKLRAAKAVFLKKDAVKIQDSCSSRSRITGLDVYECCQLLRYAGLSEHNDFFFINGQEDNPNNNIWDLISTAVWYYLEGKMNKNIDNDTSTTQTYLVDCSFFDDPIAFKKSEVTNRWWFENPTDKAMIPCSEGDYELMRQGEIPDFISVYLFGSLSAT